MRALLKTARASGGHAAESREPLLESEPSSAEVGTPLDGGPPSHATGMPPLRLLRGESRGRAYVFTHDDDDGYDDGLSSARGCRVPWPRSYGHAALQLVAVAALVAVPAYALARYLSPHSSGGPLPPPVCVSPIVAGALEITVDGVRSGDWAVVTSSPASLGRPDATALTMTYGNRAYLVRTDATNGTACPQNFTADLFRRSPGFALLGKTLSFTVDLSTTGCACCGTFYLSSMPADGPDGAPAPGADGDFACVAADAKDPDGAVVRCPEVDIIEANNRALQVCPHKCDAPPASDGRFYPACDGSGCAIGTVDFFFLPLYGPGAAYTINTLRPFDVATSFSTDAGGRLAGVVTVLSQAGAPADVTFDLSDFICGRDYLENVTTPMLEGMTPVWSVWGGTGARMDWLDVPPCDIAEPCSGHAAMTISNISITTLPPGGRGAGRGAALGAPPRPRPRPQGVSRGLARA